MKNSGPKAEEGGDSPSRLIDARIAELNDWRGEMLARVRALIRQADPDVVEEWKWRGVPVWRSEEHTSELQSLMRSSYAVFCLKKKKLTKNIKHKSTKQRRTQ